MKENNENETADTNAKQRRLTRRGFIKWTTALAVTGAAVVGIGAGYGSDLLLRPTTEKTTTATTTETATKTATTTSAQTVTAPAQTITQTATKTVTQTTAAPQETLLTGAHDTGPFVAHIVNGVWARSTPLEPNLPVGHNAYALRNRILSPDRVRYPMRRIDFSTTSRNPQNRGKSQFVRITWKEALDTVAGELQRVKSAYGPSAVLLASVVHQWVGNLHNSGLCVNANGYGWGHPSGWASRFFGLLGGYTMLAGCTSDTGSTPAKVLTFGSTAFGTTNNAADVLQNSKLVIHWGGDPGMKSYNTYAMNFALEQFKAAGIKQVFIDPYYNDSAAIYADQWIPVIPGTDEAMMAAIAYVWITQNLYNTDFIGKYTYGFDQFKAYVLGTSDGTPKTPQWAAPICGIDAATITALATEWASKPTALVLGSGGSGTSGANRRFMAATWVRMGFTLAAMQGLGLPGRGTASVSFPTSGVGMGALGGVPAMKEPFEAFIRHGQFKDAILNPPITWTETDQENKKIVQLQYPAPGMSEVKLMVFASGTGFVFNQLPNTNDHIQAVQSPKVEFVYSHAVWWEATPKFSDIILPVATVGEREDITAWQNFVVFIHQLASPPGEAMNDLDVFTQLAQRLGFADQFTQGNTPDQWLQQFYAAAKVPLSYQDLKAQGYYKYPSPGQGTPAVSASWQNFLNDPAKNPLPTPSGKIEIVSQLIVGFFGANNPSQPAFPMYVPAPEAFGTNLAQKYPLLMTSPHAKFARHSQWRNMTWIRDEKQERINGYNTMRINPVDAAARGIKDGDTVRVFNDRGAILVGASVTERIRPGIVWIWEGGWYTPQQPGTVGSLDLGGNVNLLISPAQPEPVCDGMLNNALVQVEKWSQ